MQIEALNCPNCGVGIASDATRCEFCLSRLKTQACSSCLGLMFFGSKHCPKCGEPAVTTQIFTDDTVGNCPRCKTRLSALDIDKVTMRECARCEGVWIDAITFENVCADRENNAAVLQWARTKSHHPEHERKVQYVPCPDCSALMNRNNFSRTSGVIIDICKEHGVWFDAEELPRIMEFIHAGGLERARLKEKTALDDQRRALREEEYRLSRQQNRFNPEASPWSGEKRVGIRDFLRLLFD